MQTGKHMGKVIVKVDKADMVPAIPRTPQAGVRSGVTYIIAGIGGICREIARWLAEKGAESLVFLSRSAATGAENVRFAAELRITFAVKILAFDCDVGDRAALEIALGKCSGLPPIKGCVTGAMVLDVCSSALVSTSISTDKHLRILFLTR